MVSFALALFSALSALPAIMGYLKDFSAGVMLWYVQNSEQTTLRGIADAAALAARSNTKEERDASLDAWRLALGRPRIAP